MLTSPAMIVKQEYKRKLGAFVPPTRTRGEYNGSVHLKGHGSVSSNSSIVLLNLKWTKPHSTQCS